MISVSASHAPGRHSRCPPYPRFPGPEVLHRCRFWHTVSGISSTFGFSLKNLIDAADPLRSAPPPVFRILEIGTILIKLLLGKTKGQSQVRIRIHIRRQDTCFPSSAYNLAKVAAKVVFPTPPFPVTAIFMSSSTFKYFLENQHKGLGN